MSCLLLKVRRSSMRREGNLGLRPLYASFVLINFLGLFELKFCGLLCSRTAIKISQVPSFKILFYSQKDQSEYVKKYKKLRKQLT